MPTTIFPSSPALQMPVTRRLKMPGTVIEYLDGTEQRFATGDPLNAFEVTFQEIVAADVTPLTSFLDTVKGAFDATWSFVGPDGVTYPHMALEQDDLPAMESRAARWTVSLKMRQVAQDGSYPVSTPTVYPALANGVVTQRPFTRSAEWKTTRNDLESGARYSWPEQDAHRRRWTLEYPVLTLSEVQTRIAFFIACRGRLKGFSFTDPETGDVVANCRLDQDELVVRCVGAGQWATTMQVVEVFV